jgi:hypothetical protein
MPAQLPGGLQPPGKILSRRYPVGAEPLEGDRVAVRVWAPKRERVSIVFQPGMTGAETGRSDMRPVELMRDGGGYFSAIVDEMESIRNRGALSSLDRRRQVGWWASLPD